MVVSVIILFAVILYVSYRLYQHFFPTPNINSTTGKYVLISGCDSGFGHGLAIELDKQGFNVLAGVYLENNLTSLKNTLSPKATVFRLDITKQNDIDQAFDLVKGKTSTLHALVNNAGIGVGGAIDLTSMEVMRQVMEVNYFGHVAMTKKFLPLLITKRDSRVVNICSVAGYLAGPGMSAYCASKYALESFSDCLRREMFPWGLRVSIIEPGFMKTAIIQGAMKPFEERWATMSADAQERWGEDCLREQYGKGAKSLFIKHAEDPMKVVRALQHAVMNTSPHIRYRPGWQSGIVFFPLSMLPAWFADWFFCSLDKSKFAPLSVAKQLQN